MTELADWAAAYATADWPVFPCRPDKAPHTPHGFHDATTNPNQVAAWWRRWPNAWIGIPTTNVIVIDLDVKHDTNGPHTWEQLCAHHHTNPWPATHRARTASGGLHIWYTRPDGHHTTCGANVLGPGIDIRTNGGYVIAPPSPGYEWLCDAPLADPPAWLLQQLTPPPPAPAPAPRTDLRLVARTRQEAFARTVLEGATDKVRAAPQGQGNSVLFAQAKTVAGLIAGGMLLDERTAAEHLRTAATHNARRTEHEATNTILSGFRAGRSAPLHPDLGDRRP